MKKIWLAFSLLLMLIMTFTGSAFAQGPEDGVYCGSLPTDDCDLLGESYVLMQMLTSARTETDMKFFIGNLPDSPIDELSIDMVGDSVFSTDPASVDRLAELQAMSVEEMAADIDTLVEELPDIYRSSASDTSMTFTLNDAFVEQLEADSDVSIPATFTIDLIMVDGVLYLDVREMIAMTPELAEVDGWLSLDMIEFSEVLMERMASGSMEGDENEVAQAFLGGFVAPSMADAASMDEFVEVERIRDRTVSGQDMAVFSSTFDFAAFIVSPVFRDLVVEELAQAGNVPFTAEEFDELSGMLGLVAPLLFSGLEAESQQMIGLDDLYLHSYEVTFSWDMSTLAALAQFTGDPELAALEDAPVIDFSVLTEYSEFNETMEVVAPEDVIPIPAEEVVEAIEAG